MSINKSKVINYKRIAIGALSIPLSVCLLIFSYFVIFSEAHKIICYRKVAVNINSEPTYSAFYNYIERSLSIGMNKTEVMKILSRLGLVKSRNVHGFQYPPGSTRESLDIIMCMHPLNNMNLTVVFDSNEKLISHWINDFP